MNSYMILIATYINICTDILGFHYAIGEKLFCLFNSFVELLEMSPFGLVQVA